MAKYQKVFFGDSIDIEDFVTVAAAIVGDVLGGGGSLTLAWMEIQINRQLAAFGSAIDHDTIRWLVQNHGQGKRINGIYMKFDVLTYKNEACTHWPSCIKVPLGNGHQPYLAIGKKGPAEPVLQTEAEKQHPDCTSVHKAHQNECVSAIGRWCRANPPSFLNPPVAGLTQEVGAASFGVACFHADSLTTVPIGQLAEKHPGCNQPHKAMTLDCLAASARWCGPKQAGIPQEMGVDAIAVACFTPARTELVSFSVLKTFHPECDHGHKAVKSVCMAAYNRYCTGYGAGGGVMQEVSTTDVWVSCFPNKQFRAEVTV